MADEKPMIVRLAEDFAEDCIKAGYVTTNAPSHARLMDHARASLAANAGSEPVAWLVCSVNSDGTLSLEHAAAWQEAAHEHINDAITEHGIDEAVLWVVRPAYTHPSPPEGMVAGWRPIETAPKDGTEIILRRGLRIGAAAWCHWPATEFHEAGSGWTIGFDGDSWDNEKAPTHWQPLPAPPIPASEAKGASHGL